MVQISTFRGAHLDHDPTVGDQYYRLIEYNDTCYSILYCHVATYNINYFNSKQLGIRNIINKIKF